MSVMTNALARDHSEYPVVRTMWCDGTTVIISQYSFHRVSVNVECVTRMSDATRSDGACWANRVTVATGRDTNMPHDHASHMCASGAAGCAWNRVELRVHEMICLLYTSDAADE